ncbi:MAG: hypothetical protein JWR77_2096, partial [Rhizorhabdus sp.]|nr:hypothetical protein [Rhizorhabdus sp.]
MFELHGKVAIVTGGGSGIGAAIAQRLRKAGANVLIADISDVAADAEAWGCAFQHTDVSSADQVAALCEAAVTRWGRLDIMVNNAGVARGRPLAESDAAGSERFWRTHILGVQSGIRESTKRMNPGGAIVNISSITAVRGFVTWGEYAATKAGIIS